MNEISFTIANVEKETGLSKDTLRMWERRYGFPAPERDPGGDRVYPAAQVERLRLIKRLIDQGHRPGQLMALSPEALRTLPARDTGDEPRRAVISAAGNQEIDELLALLKNHDAAQFQQRLQQTLARQGLGRFVMDTVAPLTRQVGQAWEDGRFAVFEEHLFTELTKRVLRQAIASLPPPNAGPRILLTSVPDEPHVLGLLMAEALFARDGLHGVTLKAVAKEAGVDTALLAQFRQYEQDLGYALLLKARVEDPRSATEAQIEQAANDTVPHVWPIFWGFRIMVGIGLLMLATSWAGVWALRRRAASAANSLPRPLLWSLVGMTFSGWVATVAGWYVTEIGRQPYMVFGELLTRDLVGPAPASSIAISLAAYLITYLVLIVAYISVLFYMIGKPVSPQGVQA